MIVEQVKDTNVIWHSLPGLASSCSASYTSVGRGCFSIPTVPVGSLAECKSGRRLF